MQKFTAFDSKEYRRSNKAGEQKFYTPLGCGITVSNVEDFYSIYVEKLRELAIRFGIEKCCGAFSPSEYNKIIGRGKTIRMSDELLTSVQDLIESVYFSYIVLPPEDVPSVEVGGYRSPKIEIKTFEFLKQISSFFSYITAWNYLGIGGRENEQIIIDGFHGKSTPAWDDIVAKTSPIIYSHGDECNPLISIADIICSLTDKKCWDNFKRLEPSSIEEVWENYSFDINIRFLDKNILSKIKWYTDDHIELTPYFARPIIFLKADGYKTDLIKQLEVFPDATIYARHLRGCLQGFDKDLDSRKVRDRDIFVYAGEESRNTAFTLKDMFDIEIYSFRELREKIKNL